MKTCFIPGAIIEPNMILALDVGGSYQIVFTCGSEKIIFKLKTETLEDGDDPKKELNKTLARIRAWIRWSEFGNDNSYINLLGVLSNYESASLQSEVIASDSADNEEDPQQPLN